MTRDDHTSAVRGGCLCGAIRYRLAGPPIVTSLCHCRSCRRAAGAPAVAWLVVRRDDLVTEHGTPATFRSSPEVQRTFCGQCGTPLTYRHDDSPETIDVTTATLDAPDAFPPVREIWLDHKLAWTITNDQLDHYPHDVSA